MLATYTLCNCGGLAIEEMNYFGNYDCYKVKVRLMVMDEDEPKKAHWHKVYYGADGRTYFYWGRTKIYLGECMRVNN